MQILDSRLAPNPTFLKVRQGGSNMREMVHILAIVVAQTKKLLYMSDISGCGPFKNGHQLGWVCTDLAMGNYMAQVLDLALKKCIFLHLCTYLVV